MPRKDHKKTEGSTSAALSMYIQVRNTELDCSGMFLYVPVLSCEAQGMRVTIDCLVGFETPEAAMDALLIGIERMMQTATQAAHLLEPDERQRIIAGAQKIADDASKRIASRAIIKPRRPHNIDPWMN